MSNRLQRLTYRRLRRITSDLIARLALRRRRQYYALAIVVGIMSGLGAVGFHHSIDWAERNVIYRFAAIRGPVGLALLIVAPAVGGAIAGFLIKYWAPDAAGSGIPQIKASYFLKFGRIRIRTAFSKFVLGVLCIGSGGSLGREGPTVQISAAIASWVGRMFGLPPRQLMTLVPLGAAGGIAAAFNTPLAAIVFAIEEVMGDLNHRALAGIVLVAVIAAVIERTMLGTRSTFLVPSHFELTRLDLVSALLWATLLGLLAGALSHLWVEGLLRLRQRVKNVRGRFDWMLPGLGGLATGITGTVIFVFIGHIGVLGIGYDDLSEALFGNLGLTVLVLLFAGKFAATIFSYSSGGAGGIFAPTLFMGAMLGGAIGLGADRLATTTSPLVGQLALVGMGAMFAGIIRAPVTSILIIFELTGDYSLILPIMMANLIAYGVASRLREVPVYEALLLQDGVNLRKFPILSPGRAWQNMPVKAITTHDIVTLSADDTVSKALRDIEAKSYKIFPVIDREGRFVGLIHRKELSAVPDASVVVGELIPARNAQPCYHDQTIREVAQHFVTQEWLTLPVVSRINPDRLLGVVTLHDITRQQFLQESEG